MRPASYLASIAALLGLASGCQYGAYFLRDTGEPVQALEVRMDPHARRDCLVVFMPGMLDTPDTYREQGFLADAARASGRCDLVAVDAHFGYYRSGTVRERVGQDVLRLAEARGYDEIWIVGISMGGFGTLMLAQQEPDRIRGIVLLAPFMGEPSTVQPISDAGGLARWEADAPADPQSQEEAIEAVWGWLRGYATHPDRMPELYVGVGTEDALRRPVEVLAEALPPERYGTVPGEHGWSTWRVLWQQLLRNPPWDPDPVALARGEVPRF